MGVQFGVFQYVIVLVYVLCLYNLIGMLGRSWTMFNYLV